MASAKHKTGCKGAKKTSFVCSHCGSSEVFRDAWSAWDKAKQCWELSTVFDYAHCDKCEGETSLKEV